MRSATSSLRFAVTVVAAAALSASAFPGCVAVAPDMVDAEATPANPGGWPQGGAAIPKLSNRHLEYAVTWYGLAATLIGVFFAFASGRLRRIGRHEPASGQE